MAIFTYDRDVVLERIKNLRDSSRIAFGVACCERLVPNYAAFSHEVQWGNENVLKETIERLWEHCLEKCLLQGEVERLTKACELAAPDSEAFSSPLTTFAQDAAFAVCSVLDYLSEHRVEKIAQASSYAIDTVDLYVQEVENMKPNTADLEERIKNHPLMQNEIGNQLADLDFLENGGSIQELRSRCHQRMASNIGKH
jgi:uncharacterized protein YjaG (DUF416 family)